MLLLSLNEADLVPDDDSYRAAKEMVENGSLGEIHAVETTCLDQQDPTGEQLFIERRFVLESEQTC